MRLSVFIPVPMQHTATKFPMWWSKQIYLICVYVFVVQYRILSNVQASYDPKRDVGDWTFHMCNTLKLLAYCMCLSAVCLFSPVIIKSFESGPYRVVCGCEWGSRSLIYVKVALSKPHSVNPPLGHLCLWPEQSGLCDLNTAGVISVRWHHGEVKKTLCFFSLCGLSGAALWRQWVCIPVCCHLQAAATSVCGCTVMWLICRLCFLWIGASTDTSSASSCMKCQ